MYNINLLQNPQTRMQAFAEMVNDLTPKLYTYIRRLVQYHDDADDVLQNTFMKAWQALDTFRGDCQIFTWLYRIATNESLSLLQKQSITESINANTNEQVRALETDPTLTEMKPNYFYNKPLPPSPTSSASCLI